METKRRLERTDRGRGRVPGLEVRTAADGRMSYRLRFRIKGRRRDQLTATFLGPLTEARDAARDYLTLARRGIDPRPRPQEERPLTLVRAAALWVQSNRRRWRRSTTRFYLLILRRRILPSLGDRDPRLVERLELRGLLDKIAEQHVVEANRTFATLRALYGWLNRARQERIGVTVNPTQGLERPGREAPRSTTYTDADLRRFLEHGGGLVRFLALTGVRDGEARGLTWAEVDFDRKVWTIPPARTKNGLPHAVALSKDALALLKAQQKTYALRPWVITRPTKHYTAIRLRPHDLRRTVGDRIRAEFGEATMHGVLGHQDATLTRTYGPSPRLEAQRDALEWWATQLRKIAR